MPIVITLSLAGWSFQRISIPYLSKIMRWSLILYSFVVVQSAFGLDCLALVIPPSSEQLERRAGAKISSKAYRKNSQEHDYAYKFDQTGGVTREKLDPAERLDHGQKALMIPHTDAGMSPSNVKPLFILTPCSNCRSCL
jgi:hypothetical protein